MEKRKDREAQKHATSDSVEVIREKEKRAKQAFTRMLRDIKEVGCCFVWALVVGESVSQGMQGRRRLVFDWLI